MNEEIKPENMRIHSRTDELIACLEGEIAKRDAELAACRVAVENCDLFRVRIAELEDLVLSLQCKAIESDDLRAELAATKAQEPLTVEFMQFMTAVVTGAGLLSRGKQSKGLASELSATAYKYMLGAKVSGYQQKPIGYRCWFSKEPKNIMVEWGKSLPSDMNPSATYQELYAAPVPEAKAQGLVIPAELDRAFITGESCDGVYRVVIQSEKLKEMQAVHSWLTSLNSAPVQQVSVPDEMRSLAQRLREYNQNPHHINPMSEAFHILVADAANALSTACVPKEIAAAITWSEHLLFECGALTSTRAPSVHVYNKTFAAVNEARAMLAAAPAAPAADAGLVDMYRHLQTVTPYRFKKIQDASVTDGGDVLYFHKDRFDAALLDDMAANCAAKGVV